ncbi:DnaJ-domain-containing protein [Trametes versicolor FP-101664 SS1]|uniref:DnaJ-domain-containing protein n=1 Tax=Trametes versicolor (strain FP-101664) TaxID=717944 RepID=UPI0004622408|nr:DnaJ-domain-containing protein [Trametes versicolor FP-101664 SS1]EIW62313.1 DnaJ-domain-containing protein [Trametes versicolor FP-101664 SS1]
MANYNYDEAGNMAAYFVLTFLTIFLVPYTLASLAASKPPALTGCQCQQCTTQRERIRKREGGSLLTPKLRRRTLIIAGGWSIVAFLVYKVMNSETQNKVYDPFEILGISTGTTVKEIKSHYKKLSRKFHPDKVKLAVNETMEAVEAKFVEITKAYKSLTDENIRKNWEMYGHPDGRQEVSMGIALPKWIVESGNNIWVLGAYGVIFGGALPAIVGRWWFGNREKTKDGVHTRSAAAFWKSLSEESGMDDVTSSLGKSFEWELPGSKAGKVDAELAQLESQIKEKLGEKWDELVKLAEASPKDHKSRRRAFVLLYAHLLRLPIQNSTLLKEQTQVLLQTPTLLNAMLNISMARNWLLPTLAAMRLHAFIAQAIPPGQADLKAAQLPGIAPSDASSLPKSESTDFSDAIASLSKIDPAALPDAQKALERLGHAEIVDASFKVIGERYVTPSSFVHLVVKARLAPLAKDGSAVPLPKPETNDKRDHEFLLSKKDIEDLPQGEYTNGYAHTPYWPANRKPSWWVVLADVKSNKVVVPPFKIADIPVADPARGLDYRSYKLQFQAPQTVGLFTWKVFVVSDTFVGEEAARDVVLKIDDPSVLASEEPADDDISDPEEDSLAGQMALMRGGSVKKLADGEGESDDESDTDGEEEQGGKDDDSSSDSD